MGTRGEWRSSALCVAGLAGMAYCHVMDVGMKFHEHVYYMAALFCCNIAASVALVPLVIAAGRFAPATRFRIWTAAATLAALTVAGFLWSRTLGFPEMADHIGVWDTLGLASVAFEALVIAVSVRAMLRMTRTGTSEAPRDRRRGTRAQRGRRLPLAAGVLCAVGAAVGLRHAPPPARASRCAAEACQGAVTSAVPATFAAGKRTRRSGTTRTYTYYWGPVRTGDFATHWVDQRAHHPHVNGFVIRMHARLVNRTTGQPVSIAKAMLHHLYLRRVNTPYRGACGTGRSQIFYSTGEEDETLALPRGYGYRFRANDHWRLTAMIMSHALAAGKVTIEYTMTVDRNPHLVPVEPFWLKANGCGSTVAYPVPGGGRRGSRYLRSFGWHVPFSGRIVATSGHLHGGALKMWLTQPRCHDRRLLDTNPRYGMPGDLMYHLHPVLHEPGPMDTRMFLSRTGIPVRAGETLSLKAAYDDHRPHWAVMAVMHVYLAPSGAVPQSCRPLPRDRREIAKPGPARTTPPVVRIPLTRLDSHGQPRTIHGTLGPARGGAGAVAVTVSSGGFSVPHLRLPEGAAVTWRFPEPILHDATFASGPRAVGALPTEKGGTVTVRLTVPGRYRFFCSLHPMTMHEVVDVTRS